MVSSLRSGAMAWGCWVLWCSCGAIGGCTVPPSSNAIPSPTQPVVAAAAPSLSHQVYELASADVHVVTLPPQAAYQLVVVVEDDLQPLATLAESSGAIAAINAGFFDPQNGLTTSFITQRGEVVADPRNNPRLMTNPDLAPYLATILNRSEFRIYDCGGTVQYAIARHQDVPPANCGVVSAIGAGPQILPTLTSEAEGFVSRNAAGQVVRDAIGSLSPNARSAIGLQADGTVVFVMVAQRPGEANARGLSLAALQTFLRNELQVTSALNLDGGSSSGLWYQGEGFWGRLDGNDQPIERPIKSILAVRSLDPSNP